MDSWQRWSMQGTENPQKVVQFHQNPQNRFNVFYLYDETVNIGDKLPSQDENN